MGEYTFLLIMLLYTLAILLLVSISREQSCEEQVTELRREVIEMLEKKDAEMISRLEEKDKEWKAEIAKLAKDTVDTRSDVARISADIPAVISQSVKEIPVISVCGYQFDWFRSSSTIPYDSTLSEYSNCDKPGGGCYTLDLSTGVFTALTAGHYTVTFSGYIMYSWAKELVQLYSYKNGEQIQESFVYSTHSEESDTSTFGTISRTFIVHMDIGDTLEMFTGTSFTGALYRLLFCINLNTPDY